MNESNTIKHALYLENWDYDTGDRSALYAKGKERTPTEYEQHMKGHIFCPECCVPLFRSPEDKDYATNGRAAFFAHSRNHPSDCSLRVKHKPGKHYESEEEAKKLIENQELLVIDSFLKVRPVSPDIDGPLEYSKEPNEDRNGPPTLAPIPRHTGEEFKTPSKYRSVLALCKNFDRNLQKYVQLPGQNSAQKLLNCLTNVATVKETNDAAGLYYGRITRSINRGRTSQNIRQTYLRYTEESIYNDFCIKATDEMSKYHGIDDDSTNRVAIVYGRITRSGTGLCITNLGWGEFALLPQKYEHLLDGI